MGYITAENFSKEHGGDAAIKRFNELLNEKIEFFRGGKKRLRKRTLKEISVILKLCPAQICRLRNGMFELQWVLQIGTKQLLEDHAHNLKHEIEWREEFIEEQKKLSFIPGGLNEQHRA